MQRAVKRAHSSYFLDYQKDVVSALFDKKNPYFFGLPWKTLTPGDGAVVAPVMNYNVNPKPFTDLARLVQNAFRGKSTQLYSLNSSPYYFQSTWRSPSLNAHLAPGRHDALSSPPVSSSTTATELTPSSLMSRIASSTLSLALAATTEVYRYSDGSASEARGTERKRRSAGVCWAKVVSQESSERSETTPRYEGVEPGDGWV